MNKTHGHNGGDGPSSTYLCWCNMLTRCLNPKNKRFHRYGGRGIAVDSKWLKFTAFLAEMGEKPEGKTLGRIDNDGNYCKKNCRWETVIEQANNRRGNRFITIDGIKRTVSQWSRVSGISPDLIFYRLGSGWKESEAVFNPVRDRSVTVNGITKNLTQWALETGISRKTVYKRLRLGWETVRAVTAPACKRNHAG